MPTSTSSRSFMNRGMMKSFHRKKTSVDSTLSRTTSIKETGLSPEKPSSVPVSKSPALQVPNASQRHDSSDSLSPSPVEGTSNASLLNGIYDGDSPSNDTALLSKSEPFEGLSDYHVDLHPTQSLIDPEYLRSAFGITMENSPSPNPSHSADEGSVLGELIEDGIEAVPVQVGKPQRPQIHLSIPENNTSRPVRAQLVDIKVSRTRDADKGNDSPRSIPSHSQPFTGVATARLSIISPLSVVEMPKPRRPFSAVSLEGMTADTHSSIVQKPRVVSRAATFGTELDYDLDLKGFNHSPRSSMSSSQSSLTVPKQTQEPRPRYGPRKLSAEDVVDDPTRHSRTPKNMRSASSLREVTPARTERSLNSKTSMSSLYSHANTNKPLPPEPGKPGTGSVSVSRSNSISARHKPTGSGSSISAGCGVTPTRKPSKAANLRSKYTPRDLDALDDAFQRNMPLKDPNPTYTDQPKSPSAMSNSSLQSIPLELSLSTITEASPHVSTLITTTKSRDTTHSRDTVQVSRGPMRMEPTRAPPAPPALPPPSITPTPTTATPTQHIHTIPEHRRFFTPSLRSSSPHFDTHEKEDKKKEKPEKEKKRTVPWRKNSTKRSIGSIQVATQIRPHDYEYTGHPTAVLISNSKANRILGKDDGLPLHSTRSIRTRRASIESDISPPDSPLLPPQEPTPEITPERQLTPESEVSSRGPDSHFEEIRKRLELLSPKDDPTVTFLINHENNSSARQSAKIPDSLDANLFKPYYKDSHYPSQTQYIEVPAIAELEGAHTPSPVELDATEIPAVVEIGQKSPNPEAQKLDESSSSTSEQSDETVHITPPPVSLMPPIPPPPPTVRVPRIELSTRSVRGLSLASARMSAIPEGARLNSNSSQCSSMSAEEVEQLISADAAERVLLRILESLDSFSDLFAAARVSRGFYRTFKRHELSLLKGVLKCVSSPMWELREMSIPFSELPSGTMDYTPTLYLRHYTHDLYKMIELKAVILRNCQDVLRAESIKDLSGETDRSTMMDDAIWRVWTFCRIFGCGKGREDDMLGQMDWLRGGPIGKQQSKPSPPALSDGVATNSVLFNPPKGFARGNRNITAEELYDVLEIWRCLDSLVRGYKGKRELAREYGIFDKANIPVGDEAKENAVLDAWIHHLLTLAPPVVLSIYCTTSATASTFKRCQAKGLTSWTPPSFGSSRATFLKDAVMHVHEERLTQEKPALSTQSSMSNMGANPISPPLTPITSGNPSDTSLSSRQQRLLAQVAEIRAKKNMRGAPTADDDTSSIKSGPGPTVKPEMQKAATFAATTRPSIASKATQLLSRRKKSQAIKQHKNSRSASSTNQPHTGSSQSLIPPGSSQSAQAFPSLSQSMSANEKLPVVPDGDAEYGPQVKDPVDLAVEKLVSMGYDEAAAKKALAETDRGDRVDFQKAVKALEKEKKRAELKARLDKMG
ncbi:hypothetical protein MMC25_004919 [Agyrium rufum]|nr:hypothetical protein [Agyrium rufum]